MERLTENKIVLIKRRTRLEELVARHNTAEQARFYVEHLGSDFDDYVKEDARYREALRQAGETLSGLGRLHTVDREHVPNYIFGREDIVVAVGQDGLVANTLKYLDGQPLVGVNPDPGRWDGVLLPFTVKDMGLLLPEVLAGKRPSTTGRCSTGSTISSSASGPTSPPGITSAAGRRGRTRAPAVLSSPPGWGPPAGSRALWRGPGA